MELGGIEPPSIRRTPFVLRPFPTLGLTAAHGRVRRRYESVTAGSFPGASGLSRRQPCFPAVILRFCCRAAADRPRAALRLTISLMSPGDQAARANSCFSAVVFVPRLASLSNSGRTLGQRN